MKETLINNVALMFSGTNEEGLITGLKKVFQNKLQSSVDQNMF